MTKEIKEETKTNWFGPDETVKAVYEDGKRIGEVRTENKTNLFSADEKVEAFYDSRGNRVSETRHEDKTNLFSADEKVDVTYDASGRKISETRNESISHFFTRDEPGRRTYDNDNNLISETQYETRQHVFRKDEKVGVVTETRRSSGISSSLAKLSGSYSSRPKEIEVESDSDSSSSSSARSYDSYSDRDDSPSSNSPGRGEVLAGLALLVVAGSAILGISRIKNSQRVEQQNQTQNEIVQKQRQYVAPELTAEDLAKVRELNLEEKIGQQMKMRIASYKPSWPVIGEYSMEFEFENPNGEKVRKRINLIKMLENNERYNYFEKDIEVNGLELFKELNKKLNGDNYNLIRGEIYRTLFLNKNNGAGLRLLKEQVLEDYDKRRESQDIGILNRKTQMRRVEKNRLENINKNNSAEARAIERQNQIRQREVNNRQRKIESNYRLEQSKIERERRNQIARWERERRNEQSRIEREMRNEQIRMNREIRNQQLRMEREMRNVRTHRHYRY